MFRTDHTTHHWEMAIDEVSAGDYLDLRGREPKDWFVKHNTEAVCEVYRIAQNIEKVVLKIERSRDSIEDGWLSGDMLQYEVEDVKGQLEELKSEFQSIFSLLVKLVETSHEEVVSWAGANIDLGNLSRQYRPDKKRDRMRLRLEAKRWTLIKTYIDPLLKKYPVRDAAAHPTKFANHLKGLEEAVHAFLTWLWVVYTDLTEYQIVSRSKHQVTLGLIRQRKADPEADDAIPFTDLQEEVNRRVDGYLNDDDLFDVLKDIHVQEDVAHAGVRVWDEGEPEPREPKMAPMMSELEVELVYDESRVERSWKPLIDFVKDKHL